MKIAFNQKQQLGFIECPRQLGNFADDDRPVRWLLWFVNHDPEKKALRRELEQLQKIANNTNGVPIAIEFAMGCPTGYGIFEESVVSLETFLQR